MAQSIDRSRDDRRCIDDRRRSSSLEPPVIESRRSGKDRRVAAERRSGWARITRWRSIDLRGKTL